MLFLKISQNSQESTCARVSFLIKLQADACNFIKTKTLPRCFPVNFLKCLRTSFFREHLRTNASKFVWLLRKSDFSLSVLTSCGFGHIY